MNKNLLLLLFVLIFSDVGAQFVAESGDTLYGNEWINHDQDYYKISIAEDGMYRISYDVLSAAGIPLENLEGSNFQLMHNGRAYPIYVSESGALESDDYIEFYGRRNRGELDEVFYENPETMQLNPEYSLFTDTAAYFLTWNFGNGNLRVNEVITPEEGIDLPLQEFYMHKERMVFNNRIHKPTRQGSDNVRFSHFDVGEGFGGGLRKKNQVTLRTENVYSEGPDPSLDIRFTTNATAHEIELLINDARKELYKFSGYLVKQEHIEFPMGELNTSNRIILEGLIDQFDRNIIAIADLNYPREWDFDNEKYYEFFVGEGFIEKFVEVDKFDGGSNPVIYDPGSGIRIIPFEKEGKYQFVLPGSSSDRNLIAYNGDESVIAIESLQRMDFINYGELDANYVIISHPKLMSGSTNMIDEYSQYRKSAAGGGFSTIVVNVEDLYEQYSYGVQRHSYAVKNFVNWISKNWTNPEYIFIVGKGREYATYRTEEQIEDPLNSEYTVPTFGYPGSDNLLLSNGNIKTTHVIPGGRLAARSITDVEIYLEKVKEHESFYSKPQTIEDKLWKKRIMHLAGAETALQENIGSFLESMETIIENNEYGAQVTTYKKSSTETIQEADADGLINTIDAGLSIMTFFGHSSVGTFDFNIDDVNKLSNFGKYPLVISLGCYSGNIHTSSYGISEQYISTRNRGAIAFMASSSTAYVPPQGNFGKRYYTKIGGDYFGSSLGKVLQETLSETDHFTNIQDKILNEQMTLHGDPAIVLYDAPGPDYVFDYSSFKTDPNIVESNTAEFDLEFKVVNLGKVDGDTLDLRIEHYTSDGALSTSENFSIRAPEFDTLMRITLNTEGSDNVGRNLIKGEIDYTEEIEEKPNPAAEQNNILVNENGDEGFPFFTINNSAVPVHPCDLGIYNTNEVVLQASSYNALAKGEVKYLMEVDTTQEFNSPLKKRTEINSQGGLIEWAPELNFEQGKVYYWRVSPDSINEQIGYKWEDASFIYLPNSSNGWNQSHYYQFLDNEYDDLVLNRSEGLTFDTSGAFFKVFNSIYDFNTTGLQFNFDDFAGSVRPWTYMDGGVAVFVRDHVLNRGWVNSGGDYGSIFSTSFGSRRSFGFDTNTEEGRAALINFIENVVPDGDFIFLFTVISNINSEFSPELWAADSLTLGTNIYEVLENQGATAVRQLEDRGVVPYTFIYEKGGDFVFSEEIGEDIESAIVSTAFIPIRLTEGNFSTKLIGPSNKWDRFLWKNEPDNSADTTRVSIFGTDQNGVGELLFESTLETEIDLSAVDVNNYPFLKITTSFKDEENITPSKLNYMRVFYEGFPDINLSSLSDFYFNKDTLQRGENLSYQIGIENLSEQGTDSLLVRTEISGKDNSRITIEEKIGPIGAEGSASYQFSYNTSEMTGAYQIAINVVSEKLEKNYFNNFGLREFLVISDERNPVLDVSFDGNRILDGDIVSPTPFIRAELKDENPFLLLDDPSIFDIILIDPNGQEEKIDLSDDRINFIPAESGDENVAYLEFSPDLQQDGIYTLKINAIDKERNFSGNLNFERSFEVINEQMVSDVLNYPNPFSTSTEFIFTLTGREIPDELSIQIMTVSGKVVKQIFKEELGNLKIGVNRTSYKWDGMDDYGNKLANGVYLYRVIANHQNESVSKFDLGLDEGYFKNSLGKLVILR